jgi:signal transduction histidine kinase
MNSATAPSGSSQPAASTIPWSDVLTPRLLVGFVGIIAILIGTLVVGLANLRTVHVTSEAVAQTHSVKVAFQHVLTTIVDAETGERGFIITGAASYLEPYDRAREAIAAEFERAGALIANDHEQRADFDQLSGTVELKLRELAEAIRQRRESGFSAAQAQVATNVGKRTMDGIRAIVARMEAREDALLAARTAQAERSYGVALVTGFISTAMALVALIALFFGTLAVGTTRLIATRAANAQQQQLREALRQKDDFVAVVSHELRTPTNTIVGWARMLADHTMSAERSKKAIDAIGRNAESLHQLIGDLMDTSQLVSGRMRLSIDAVNLEEVVRDAMDAVRLSAENKGVGLTEVIQSDLQLMKGDPGRLKQVVWNLLANAIKFTPGGGVVTLTLASFDAGVRLTVHDTGEGIDASFLPHVFERYRQAAPGTQSRRGIGLGLAIVRHLVELHGGTVSAQSAGLGQGSTFVIELPLMPRVETPRVEPETQLA